MSTYMNGTNTVYLSTVLAADQPAAAAGFNPMNLVLFALFGLVIFMMFRKQKKTKAAAEEQRSKLATGVQVMTNFGLFGKVLSIDEAENKIELELSPGNTAMVHRQTVAKIIEPEALETANVPDDVSSLTLGLEKKDASEESAEETLARLNNDKNKDN